VLYIIVRLLVGLKNVARYLLADWKASRTEARETRRSSIYAEHEVKDKVQRQLASTFTHSLDKLVGGAAEDGGVHSPALTRMRTPLPLALHINTVVITGFILWILFSSSFSLSIDLEQSAGCISLSIMMNMSLVQFDLSSSIFFVVKQEPPNKYRGLGNSLSTRRNREAETGQSHVTASKLGALFDGVIPSTPDLIRAYGSRCSEIASSQTFNPPGTQKHGLFANQVGTDGTTIWAAATSGPSAIAVHLLACMLARMWDSPKAISIWSKLIAIRKQALQESGRPMDYHAARIELPRDQIAN
jgi:hypothetical protein